MSQYNALFVLSTANRLVDASRLLEVLLFAAEKFRDGTRYVDGHRSSSSSSKFENSFNVDQTSESELLFQKARNISSEFQNWSLAEVFPIQRDVHLSRRLDAETPPAILLRPGAEQSLGRCSYSKRKRRSMLDMRSRHTRFPRAPDPVNSDKSRDPFPQIISPLLQTSNQMPYTPEPISSISVSLGHPLGPASPDPSGQSSVNASGLKDLHMDLKLDSLSALIGTLEHVDPAKWINHYSDDFPLCYRSPTFLNSTTHHIQNSVSLSPDLYSFKNSSSQDYNLSQTDTPDSSNVTSNCCNTPRTDSRPSELSHIQHWESLLAASLLSIQLWKLVLPLQRSYAEATKRSHFNKTSFSTTFNTRPPVLDSSNSNTDDIHEWISQLDSLTSRLELIAQTVIQLSSRPIEASLIPTSFVNPYRFNDRNPNNAITPQNQSQKNESQNQSPFELSSNSIVYMLSRSIAQKDNSRGVQDQQKYSEVNSQQKKKDSHVFCHHPTERDVLIPSNSFSDDEVRNLSDQSLKEESHPMDIQAEPFSDWQTQMYLSRVTVPRLVPIWDDTLEAEVKKSRLDEVTAVQKALYDLRELTEDIAIRTVAAGEELKQAELAVENTDIQTRQAAVELAKANKARSSWWGIKSSGVGTVGAAVLGGITLGPVGAVAGGSIGGAAALIAGNSVRRRHDNKMNAIVEDMSRTDRRPKAQTSSSSRSSRQPSRGINDAPTRIYMSTRMPFL